jgi:hypothetical protein
MSSKSDPSLLEPPWVPRSFSAADARRVHRLWQGIFADLLPRSTKGAALLHDPAAHGPSRLTVQVGKASSSMKAYRTESPYYFSSKQLLPIGAVVFFSEKLKRYVHPTEGILFDPHPRLQSLSAEESLELETHWQESLSRY